MAKTVYRISLADTLDNATPQTAANCIVSAVMGDVADALQPSNPDAAKLVNKAANDFWFAANVLREAIETGRKLDPALLATIDDIFGFDVETCADEMASFADNLKTTPN